MLTVHHLHVSQSERIVWLCEELGLDYTLRLYDRDPVTRLGQADYKALYPMGIAPVIDDDDVRLGESGAIVEYLLTKHGGGRLALGPTEADYPQYLYWLHFANGNLQPVMGRAMILNRLDLPADNPVRRSTLARLDLILRVLEERLSVHPWLAGETFTAADIMTVFSLTTMRAFCPLDLAPRPHIRAYLARIGERPAYRRAMAKGDADMTPMLS
jgi:glutathione S-transferase